ncbi:D-alanyl-D-alanine carboxypeptidase [Candidatus Woesebacteria bacterium]|nr:D-alanyl-D-alanine carboxypeptidase [Candidatus Woesebacteria bacterium]
MRLLMHQWASVFCVCCVLLGYKSINQEKLHARLSPPPQTVTQIALSPVPILASQAAPVEISALAAVALDQKSGAILYEKNAYKIYAPASTTKLMTALVAREVYTPGTILTAPALTSVGGSKIGLVMGEQLSLESLLEGALIPSGNDAAYTIAFNHPAGLEVFLQLMNKKAQDLHLNSTYFENPTGFDSSIHRTTAFDLALLAREVMKDSLLRSIVRTKQTVVTDLTGKRRHPVVNTNQLLGVDPEVVGVKTGTTEEAGQVLISQFETPDSAIVIVVLGSVDRYADTRTIRAWIRDSYSWERPAVF